MKKNIKLYSLYIEAINHDKKKGKKETIAFITGLNENVKDRARNGFLTYFVCSESYRDMIAMRWFRRFSGYSCVNLTEQIRLSNNKKRHVVKIRLDLSWDLIQKKKIILLGLMNKIIYLIQDLNMNISL